MTGSQDTPSFRLAYVPGVTPAKWVRIWEERFPEIPLTLHSVTAAEAPDVLRVGDADAGFVRLPVDRTVFSAIPLYTETTVVVVPKDHVISAVDEVTAEDLADEVVFHPLDDVIDWERPPGQPAFERPATTADAVELVAANVGLLVVPQSLARLHHRKDLTYRPLVDAPQSSIALSWPEDATTDQVEDFIGVVRGRTVNSTRGRMTSEASAAKDQPKRGRPESGGSARRQPGAGGRSGRGGSGGAKGAKGGAKGTRRGKPRNR
ncbi:LysR substrate binding domain-containing protein [Streptomyces sp. cf386]|uniref:LysR family substrate-binding domain-containing protein n=1 Tax=Streptomyces sp. cf386 TaxID=1761904 RepID=UPI000884E388|nr:LysR family substrate-binding domain-containing protein [Streptomyces sp. cf386]SDM38149.1 LysR substrate binding domain-containing protein [Streptomyces sp. cf386]